MHIARKMLLWLVNSVFRTGLVLLAVVGTVIMLFGSPTHIKKALSENKIYSAIVDTILTEVEKETSKSTETELPIGDEKIKDVIKTAFPDEFLQNSTEQIIDSLYAWLEAGGTQDRPVFSIDITEPKQKLASGFADYAEQTLSALPVCTKQQLTSIDVNNFNAFSATCRPATLNVATEKQKFQTELDSKLSEIGKDNKFGSADLNDDGKDPFADAQDVPKGYRAVKDMYWLLGIVVVLLGASVIFLHQTKRGGLKNISFTLLGSGIVLGALSLVTNSLFDKVLAADGKIGEALADNSLQRSFLEALRDLSGIAGKTILYFAIVYCLIGGGVLLALHFTKPSGGKNETPKLPKDEQPKDQPSPDKVKPEPKDSSN